MTEECRACKFWLKKASGEGFGYCKRYPPYSKLDALLTQHDFHPVTRTYHWCGEWRAREGHRQNPNGE
jgi:hypothetical protein